MISRVAKKHLVPDLCEAGNRKAMLVLAVLLVGSYMGLPVRGFASNSTAPIPTAVPYTFFGLTTLNFYSFRQAQALPYGTTRSWDSLGLSWAEINTSRGVYNFTALNEFMSINVSRHIDMIYTFGRTPQWASSAPDVSSPYGPGECAPPANIADWDNYVTAIVTQAAGRIKYWELWNEPNDPQTWCGPAVSRAPDLVTLAQHAYAIIKQLQPDAVVLSPSLSEASGPSWLNWYLSVGGGNYLDVVAFHGYSSTTAEDILTIEPAYVAVMARWGLSGIPIWDTENSWATGSSPVPMETQVAFVAKTYLLHWSLGIPRLVWYAYDGDTAWGGLWTSSSGPTLAGTAFSETARWMSGGTLIAPCSEDDNSVWTCQFTYTNGNSTEAIWISNSNANVTVPSKFTVYADLAGVIHPIDNHSVIIGDQPILLEVKSL
jgi:hypothetical protein